MGFESSAVMGFESSAVMGFESSAVMGFELSAVNMYCFNSPLACFHTRSNVT